MDMLDQALETGGQEPKASDSPSPEDQVTLTEAADGTSAITDVASQGTISLDPSMQYQFRAEATQGLDGQVTYRVVQVAQPDGGDAPAQVVQAFPAGTQVIQSPFNGGSPSQQDDGAEQRFTYFPTVTAAGDAVSSQGNEVATVPLGQVSTAAGGQFYVMMSPQDVLQGQQRTLAPRTHSFSPKIEGGRNTRDERRRATHNEVERRRRDKINSWIVQLSKLVPECAQDHTKQGQVVGNKGAILSKACDYINELRATNLHMGESLKETERLSVDTELLRQQCEELKQENAVMRATLQQHGIVQP
ncbi:upstream stimulatory factor-like isoform X2 [Lineus longissimus]|uniref:upstream stimulatory factor-like isoform X2 n=1 Tax=Lineus longissimus TaxID=88925 RepID=UPI002B4EA3B6